MKKLFLVLTIVFTGLVAAQPQPLQFEDNQGHSADLSGTDTSGNVVVYGEGTTRYVRILDGMEVSNGTEIQVCIPEVEGENLSYTFELSSGHPDDVEGTKKTCNTWEMKTDDFQNQLIFSVWMRDQDDEYLHNEASKSDYYLGVRYENVTKARADKGVMHSPSLLENLMDWLTSLLP